MNSMIFSHIISLISMIMLAKDSSLYILSIDVLCLHPRSQITLISPALEK